MQLALIALPGVITSCLLAWVLSQVLSRQNEERQAHRIEVDGCRQDMAELVRSHREEMAAFNQARLEEVANLLQRIQAPEAAVAQHAGQNAQEDPERLDLEDDLAVVENYEQTLKQALTEMVGRSQ
jgi:uncharacterized protein